MKNKSLYNYPAIIKQKVRGRGIVIAHGNRDGRHDYEPLSKGKNAMFDFLRKKQGSDNKPEKLPGPKELPDDVGSHLVTKMKQNPDWVWSLKSVLKPDKEKGSFFVRVFDANAVYSKGLTIKDYHSFETHSELVLYDGWFNKNTHEVKLESRKQAA